ncbi:MAG TPA: acyl-CoA dehydrogenase family protein, partial [Acidimicrobiales bacterium]|nr:acyl-CoA dehydrogenase family protein [Acidimicrobiales bacterium]
MTTTDWQATETDELAAFRAEVRAFLAEHAPKRATRGDDDAGPREAAAPDLATQKAFQAALADAGLAGLTWPRPWGPGLTSEHQRVFNEEAAGFDLPTTVYTIGLGMVIPTMIEFGTDAQRQRYVPKALRGEEIWSQLFSEPGAGSDVASLQMRAERDGDEWVLNGQKVWTTGAQLSDFGAVVARTNPDNPKHRGITMFIIDFRAPGVEVRPLRQMNGGSGFNEVFFTDVRVPDANRIGEVDDGWRCAIAMLMNERVAIGSGGGGGRGTGVKPLIDLARRRDLLGDPVVRQGIADVYIRTQILGYIGQRTRAAVKAGRAPGPEGSIAKLVGALLSRRTSDLGIAMAGAGGQA